MLLLLRLEELAVGVEGPNGTADHRREEDIVWQDIVERSLMRGTCALADLPPSATLVRSDLPKKALKALSMLRRASALSSWQALGPTSNLLQMSSLAPFSHLTLLEAHLKQAT